MTETLALTLTLLCGIVLGAFFFGGLWWTVQRGVRSENPALLFLVSLLVRTVLVLAGFIFLSQGNWLKLVVCLIGFQLARTVIMRRVTQVLAEDRTRLEMEVRSAN